MNDWILANAYWLNGGNVCTTFTICDEKCKKKSQGASDFRPMRLAGFWPPGKARPGVSLMPPFSVYNELRESRLRCTLRSYIAASFIISLTTWVLIRVRRCAGKAADNSRFQLRWMVHTPWKLTLALLSLALTSYSESMERIVCTAAIV